MTHVTKVLLVEDSLDAAMLVKAALRGGKYPFEVDWEQDLTSALRRLAGSTLDAVLLDLNLPDSEGFATFTRVRRAAPESAIIVLTADEDDQLAINSVRGGAEEYLLKKDISAGVLGRRLMYAVERNRTAREAAAAAVRPGRIVSLIGAKGGCGVTTLTINLGYALAQLEHSVIAVEMGEEAGFAAHLLLPPQTRRSLDHNSTYPSPEALETAMVRLSSGFNLICSPYFQPGVTQDQPGAEALVNSCSRKAAYVLLDCPNNLQPSTIAALKASDPIFLLLERSELGLRAAKQKVDALSSLGATPADIFYIVVNKWAFMESVGVATIRQVLQCERLFVLPPGGDELSRKSAVLAPSEPPSDSLFAETVRKLAVFLAGADPAVAPAQSLAEISSVR